VLRPRGGLHDLFDRGLNYLYVLNAGLLQAMRNKDHPARLKGIKRLTDVAKPFSPESVVRMSDAHDRTFPGSLVFSPSEDRSHHARATVAVHDGDYPERFLIGAYAIR